MEEGEGEVSLEITLPVGVHPREPGVYPTQFPNDYAGTMCRGFSYFHGDDREGGNLWGAQFPDRVQAIHFPGGAGHIRKQLSVILQEPVETDWFPPEVKPMYPGVYKTYFLGTGGEHLGNFFSMWDGQEWKDSRETANEAQFSKLSGYQKKFWKGLMEGKK